MERRQRHRQQQNFIRSKVDPTIINGGVINSFNSNAKLGKGDWAILEADESDGSFLKLPINYSIVTNIDYEHLDFYKNYKNLENSFLNFINKTPPTGKSIICIDNNNVKKILNKIKNKNILTYGENKKANYQIKKIKYLSDSTSFDLKFKDKDKKIKIIKNINVKLLGKHNVLNASAALIVCLNLGANINIIKKSLKNFSGVQRRMTKFLVKIRMIFMMITRIIQLKLDLFQRAFIMLIQREKLSVYLNLTDIQE